MSKDWKLVSLHALKPMANSIWAREQLPLFPMTALLGVQTPTETAEEVDATVETFIAVTVRQRYHELLVSGIISDWVD